MESSRSFRSVATDGDDEVDDGDGGGGGGGGGDGSDDGGGGGGGATVRDNTNTVVCWPVSRLSLNWLL